MMTKNLVLASASPRREQLLRDIGLRFSIHPANIDETPPPEEPPERYVARMARAKADRVALTFVQQECIVLGADTVVVLDGDLLGKPSDDQAGLAMLRRLAGRTHEVLTAFCAVRCGVNGGEIPDDRREQATVSARVRFRELTESEIRAYWAVGESRDKAGSYGIQGIGSILVEHLEGSYSAVVGLPLAEVELALARLGLPTWEMRLSEKR